MAKGLIHVNLMHVLPTEDVTKVQLFVFAAYCMLSGKNTGKERKPQKLNVYQEKKDYL